MDPTYLQREFGADFRFEEIQKEIESNAENKRQLKEAIAVLFANIGKDIDAKMNEIFSGVSLATGNINLRLKELEASLQRCQQAEERLLSNLERLKSALKEKEQRTIKPVPLENAESTATFPLEIVWGQLTHENCVRLTVVNFKKYQYSNVYLELHEGSALVAAKPCGTILPGAQTVTVEAQEVPSLTELRAQLLCRTTRLSLSFDLEPLRAPQTPRGLCRSQPRLFADH